MTRGARDNEAEMLRALGIAAGRLKAVRVSEEPRQWAAHVGRYVIATADGPILHPTKRAALEAGKAVQASAMKTLCGAAA